MRNCVSAVEIRSYARGEFSAEEANGFEHHVVFFAASESVSGAHCRAMSRISCRLAWRPVLKKPAARRLPISRHSLGVGISGRGTPRSPGCPPDGWAGRTAIARRKPTLKLSVPPLRTTIFSILEDGAAPARRIGGRLGSYAQHAFMVNQTRIKGVVEHDRASAARPAVWRGEGLSHGRPSRAIQWRGGPEAQPPHPEGLAIPKGDHGQAALLGLKPLDGLADLLHLLFDQMTHLFI